jgi:hypothetical protein
LIGLKVLFGGTDITIIIAQSHHLQLKSMKNLEDDIVIESA